MKFLHTADWQLGMEAARVGDVGERVREERLLAARKGCVGDIKVLEKQGI